MDTRKSLLSRLRKRDQVSSRALLECLAQLPTDDSRVILSCLRTVGELNGAYIPEDEWKRALALFALDITRSLHHVVLKIHLKELSKAVKYEKYWEQCLQSPWVLRCLVFAGSQYPRSPEEILETVASLQKIRKTFVEKVGILHLCLEEMRVIKTMEGGAHQFAHYIESIYFFICDKQPPKPMDTNNQVTSVLRDAVLALPDFETWFEDQLREVAMPSHLRRNWLKYVGGVGAGIAAARLLNQHKEIFGWGSGVRSSLRIFFKHQLVEPSQSIYNHVFHTLRDRQSDMSAARKSLELNQQALSHMLLDFGRAQASTLADEMHISREQLLSTLPARANNHDMQIVMSAYEKDIQKPVSAALSGTLVTAFLIQMQKLKIDTETALLSLDQILNANEINIQLMALIPAALLVVGALWVTGDALVRWSGVSRQRHSISTRVIQARIKHRIRYVERILVTNADGFLHLKDDPAAVVPHGESEVVKRKRERETGNLIWNIHLAVIDLPHLPSREREPLTEDLRFLASLEHDVQQKLMVIHSMYRNYPWLAHTPLYI